MTGYIFLAGEIADYGFFEEYDLDNGVVICADGGYAHAEKLGITPRCIVGDMDSIAELPAGVESIKYDPVDKDYTDGNFAVKLAAEAVCDEIIIFGAINKGSSARFDHVFGNVYLLKLAQSLGMTAKIVESDCEIMLISEYAEIARGEFKYLSFLPFAAPVKGITLTGVKYPLDKAGLTSDNIITMSNEFAADIATVSVEEGELLAIVTK
ncbi:MAG: thiamine diphosphokinase [Oscillospiraceae bacterium]|nr:thiamine diphosphokinase [Oscillospiraceae bacterium]